MSQLGLPGVQVVADHLQEGVGVVDGDRETLDAYWTPEDDARMCCLALAARWEQAPRSILEPSVGGGSWVRAARHVWGEVPYITGVDIDPDAPGLSDPRLDAAIEGDYLSMDLPSIDLVLGNPPYSELEAWLDRPLQEGRARRVAWLLRSTALGSVSRLPWWRCHPPAFVWVLPHRPRWKGPGARKQGDSVGARLVLWEHDYTGPTQMGWLDPLHLQDPETKCPPTKP